MTSKERRRIEAEERNRRSALIRKHQAKVDQIEKEIAGMEERQNLLTEELEKPETYQNGPRIVEINQELKMISDTLEAHWKEWENAQEALESSKNT